MQITYYQFFNSIILKMKQISQMWNVKYINSIFTHSFIWIRNLGYARKDPYKWNIWEKKQGRGKVEYEIPLLEKVWKLTQ